jgi:uncharacterized protein DUF3489
MSKFAKKQSTAASTVAALTRKLAAHPKTKKPDHASKQSQVVAMLKSPKGATITAMMKATGWQQHSVRGFLAGVVRKRLKFRLDSKLLDGERVYHVAGLANTNLRTSHAKRPSR